VSFKFTDRRPDQRSFTFTATNREELEEQLQTIADMATEILRLVSDVRRQLNH
jgi:hypothetical protein